MWAQVILAQDMTRNMMQEASKIDEAISCTQTQGPGVIYDIAELIILSLA